MEKLMGRIVLFLTVLMVATMAVAVGVAGAQEDPYGGGEPVVLPTHIERDEQPAGEQPAEQPPVVLDERITRPGVDGDGPRVDASVTNPEAAPGILPFTGADLTLFVIVGATLGVVGIAIVRRTRRSES